MLHRLEIENFYSIRDRQIIDLCASAKVIDEDGRLARLWKGSEQKAPKVVSFFGANASGKSNVLRALVFISWFVKDSFSPANRLPFDRFNDKEKLQAPTVLTAQFSGPSNLAEFDQPDTPQCKYEYTVTIGGGTGWIVENEILSYWPSGLGRKTTLFKRDISGKVIANRAFGLSGFSLAVEKILRKDASLISTLAQLEHPFSKLLRAAASLVISNIFSQRHEPSDDEIVRHYADNPKWVTVFNREIERIDVGIQRMEIIADAQGPLARFAHQGLEFLMPVGLESQGTRHFMKIFPLLLGALENGGVAIIDELDSAIHPMLLPEMVRWFYDPLKNLHNAQLWMSCHNASLLEDLTKEEIFFCEKDAQGRTEVYGLKDIQSVRRNDNYYQKYLGGVFGAVPQIG